MEKRPYKIDIAVRVLVWNRPECQKKQWEVIKEAAPRILFLISDGGRTTDEMERIKESRKVVEDIDWECKVYKLYFDENQGMYGIGKPSRKLIWSTVDRCIFLEDDYVPAVSFFRFCAELLEKYKDDDRIEMITGHNPFDIYEPAEPNDYFFTEVGWSIWGTACWRRTVENYSFPFDYEDNDYIKKCLKESLSEFWYKKVEDYCNRRMNDNHIPGSEYYHAVNSVLFHRLSIVPTKNMIKNIGTKGAHADVKKDDPTRSLYNMKTYEIGDIINHPKYVIDDKNYGAMYSNKLGHDSVNPIIYFFKRVANFIKLLLNGKAIDAVKNKLSPQIER